MTAEAILAGLPVWQGKPELTPVEEGRTNRNFIIRDSASIYFGRVGVDLPHHGVRRSNERLCAQLAAERGVAPQIHYAGDGILVTQFVNGETLRPETIHDAHTLRQVAGLLRHLHAEPATVPGLQPCCGVAASLTYLAGTPDSELPLGRARIIERIGAPSIGGDRLVHCDIIPENLMRNADRMLLIDWEYAGVGIAEIDLASVIANADLSRSETADLLEAYGPHDASLLEQQRVALVVREALWCLAQLRHAGPGDELVAYTQRCMGRMLKEFP
jgi:thiamine kinase-like enzyme